MDRDRSEKRRLNQAVFIRLDPPTMLHLQAAADRTGETVAGWIRSRLRRSFFPAGTPFPPAAPPRRKLLRRSAKCQQRSQLIAHLARLIGAVSQLCPELHDKHEDKVEAIDDVVARLLEMQKKLVGITTESKR